MPDSSIHFKTKKLGRIQEERQFTNPAIRFVRIKGRIVPIINKKRIGQIANRGGSKALSTGLKILAGAAALGIATKIGGSASKRLFGSSVLTGFASSPAARLMTRQKSGARAAVKLRKLSRSISKASKFTVRAGGGFGLGLVAIGGVARSAGFELESRSTLGFDVLPGNPIGKK